MKLNWWQRRKYKKLYSGRAEVLQEMLAELNSVTARAFLSGDVIGAESTIETAKLVKSILAILPK